MINAFRWFATIQVAALVAISAALALPLRPPSFCQHTQPKQSGATGISLSQVQHSATGTGAVFIENKGQWDQQVKFLLQSSGLNMWITDRGVRYDLFTFTSTEKSTDRSVLRIDSETEPAALMRRGHVVGISFEGAAFSAQGRGMRQQPGAYNYFIGNDRSKWASGVRLFSEARLNNLYDGIDAVFYLDEGRPRYDLVVQPGVDPAQVQMKIEGSNGVSVSTDGSLAIRTTMGVLQQQGLYAYQEVEGIRRQVACRFVVGKDEHW